MSSTHQILFTACRTRSFVRTFVCSCLISSFFSAFFYLCAIFFLSSHHWRSWFVAYVIGESLVNVLIVLQYPWRVSLLASVFSLLFYRHTENSCNVTTAHISNIRIFILKSAICFVCAVLSLVLPFSLLPPPPHLFTANTSAKANPA